MAQTAAARLDALISHDDPTNLFELHEELAEGSFGVVYSGTYLVTKSTVALKIISLEEGESFDDLAIEIDILKASDHANVVKYHGGWRKDNELFIAMELCEGGSVAECCHEVNAPLNEALCRFALKETFEGLLYLHRCGIVHRDIKGANVLCSLRGELKLADFGVSARLTADEPVRGTFVGTPFWMAPEVIAAKSFGNTYNEISDVWSMGILTIEFAEKRTPLCDMNPMAAIFKIPMLPPPTFTEPKKFSAAFNDFLARMLVKDPAQRPSAEHMLRHEFMAEHNANGAPQKAMAAFVAKARQNAARRRQTVKKASGTTSTLRSQRPTTVREGAQLDEQLAQRAVRKALRKQMALIQRAQKAQKKERDKVLKRQEKERAALEESGKKRLEKLARQRANNEAQLAKQQKAESLALAKQAEQESKALKKLQETEQKTGLKKFRDQAKKQNAPKKGVQLAEFEFKNQLAQQQLLATYKHRAAAASRAQKLVRAHHQALSNLTHDAETARHSELSAQLKAREQMARAHLAELQELQTKNQVAKHQIEKDELLKQIKLQQKALLKQAKGAGKEKETAARKQAAELQREQVDAQAQAHKYQRRELNVQLVEADERLAQHHAATRRDFRRKCAGDRIAALKHFQHEAHKQLLAYHERQSELRRAQRSELLALREAQIKQELAMVKQLDPARLAQAEESKTRQLQALARDEEHKSAQLAEKHAQQLQAFRAQIKQQLKDVRDHYGDLYSGGSTTRRSSSGGTQHGTSQRRSSSEQQHQQQRASTPPPKAPRRETAAGDERASLKTQSRDSSASTDDTGAGDDDEQDYPTVVIEPISSGAAQDLGTVVLGTSDFSTMARAAAAPAAAAASEPDFAASFDEPQAPSQQKAAPAEQRRSGAGGDGRALAQTSASPAARSAQTRKLSQSTPTPQVEPDDSLPDGWVALKAPDGRTYYQNNVKRITQWKRPTGGAPNGRSERKPSAAAAAAKSSAASKPRSATDGASPLQSSGERPGLARSNNSRNLAQRAAKLTKSVSTPSDIDSFSTTVVHADVDAGEPDFAASFDSGAPEHVPAPPADGYDEDDDDGHGALLGDDDIAYAPLAVEGDEVSVEADPELVASAPTMIFDSDDEDEAPPMPMTEPDL